MDTEKQRLINRARELGVELRPTWPARRIREEIVRHQASAGPVNMQQSRRERLEQRATQFGMLVAPTWDDDQLEQAVQLHEEVASQPPAPVVESSIASRRLVGRPQRGRHGGWSPRG